MAPIDYSKRPDLVDPRGEVELERDIWPRMIPDEHLASNLRWMGCMNEDPRAIEHGTLLRHPWPKR